MCRRCRLCSRQIRVFFSSGIWRSSRARTSASVAPGRSSARAICCSRGHATTISFSKSPMPARFDQNRRHVNDDRMRDRARRSPETAAAPAPAPPDARSHSASPVPPGSVNTIAASRDRSIAPSSSRMPRPNCRHDRRVGRAVRLHHFVAQLVGLNQITAQFPQRVPPQNSCRTPGRRSGPRSACLRRKPVRRSAASIVFCISIAIVNGPTPPGTGV